MAMHGAVLATEEIRQLRSENARQKQKRGKKRKYIGQGGTFTVEEGADRAKRRAQGPEESSGQDEGPTGQTDPQQKPQRKRGKCSKCGSLKHNARTCKA